jgi:tetratricopeptide (TPR) repeat protein
VLPLDARSCAPRTGITHWVATSLALCLTGCATNSFVGPANHRLTRPIAEAAWGRDLAGPSRAPAVGFGVLPFFGDLAAPRGPKARELLRRAEQAYFAGDHAAAVTTLRRIRDLEPLCTAGLALEAQIALDRGDVAACALAAQAASTAHPDSVEVQFRAGSLLMQLGERRGGLLALEAAHRLTPHDARIARALASAYVSMRNQPAAEMVLRSALLRSPGDAGISVALARLSDSEDRWTHASFYYDLAFDSCPPDDDWLARRAHALYQSGNLDRAREDFELCADRLHDRAAWDLLWEFTDACRRLGDDDRAQAIRDQLPIRPPESPSIASAAASH